MAPLKRELHVEEVGGPSTAELEAEVVERKGKGHPDQLIDGAAEAVSDALSHYYLRRFGRVLHYNVDKGILVGGSADARFGGGEVTAPVYVMVAGRATSTVQLKMEKGEIPVAEIARDAMVSFVKDTMRFLDPDKHMEIETRIRPGSPELVSLFMENEGMPVSNDTSMGVGYAPLTPTENAVLAAEKELNSPSFKRRYPEVGEDVKVLGLRRGRKLGLVVAAAMVGGRVRDSGHYISVVQDVKREVERVASSEGLEPTVRVNAADDYERGRFYLTVTGTSAEQGDDGNTGRGNRVNGLISPMRHYSMEATAGKNPVNHTGKIYNALAVLAAERVVERVGGVKECCVTILSRIGSPIDQPELANAQLVLHKDARLSAVRGDVESIVDDCLARVRETTELILQRRVALF